MEFPIEILQLIKEFSMPKYKKPLHYKAIKHDRIYNIFDKSYSGLFIYLNRTPYTRVEIILDKSDFITDMMRGDKYWSWGDDFSYLFDIDYDYDFLIDNNNGYLNNMNIEISDEEVELTDIIILK